MSQSKVAKVGKVAFVPVHNGWPILRIAGRPSYLLYYHIHFDTSSDVGLFFFAVVLLFLCLLSLGCLVLGPHPELAGVNALP